MPKTKTSKATLQPKTKLRPTQLLVLVAVLVVVGVIIKFASHASSAPPKLSIDVFNLPNGVSVPMTADSSLGTCGKSFTVVSQDATATIDNDVLYPAGNSVVSGIAPGQLNCLGEDLSTPIGGTVVHFPQTISSGGRTYTATYSCSGEGSLFQPGGFGGCGGSVDGSGYVVKVMPGFSGGLAVYYQ